MSRTLFWSIYTPFAVLALITGWILGTPRHPAASLTASVAQATQVGSPPTAAAPANPPVAQGADGAAGWEARQALRGKLSATLDTVESSPCEPDARAAFLTAYADRAGAISDAASSSSTGNRPDFWQTSDDATLDQRVDQLEKQRWFTQDEVGMAVVRRRMGDALVAAQATPGSLQAMKAAAEVKCPNLAASPQSQG